MPDMRFAPAPVMLAQTSSGGLNQTNVRSHNERLILDILRRNRTLSRFEIGQRSKLSAQTVSVLVRALKGEGLLAEGEVHRGRVGPPTTPFSLNPDGAYAIGVYAGMRVLDVCLLDFCGALREMKRVAISEAEALSDQISKLCEVLLNRADRNTVRRCLGLGVALHKTHWPSNADGEIMTALETHLTEVTKLPCFLLEDVTSAATGEVLFGSQTESENFVFVHLGLKTTVRVVLNGQAQSPFDEALLPISGLDDLAQRLETAGHRGHAPWLDQAMPPGTEDIVEDWVKKIAQELSSALVSILAVLEVPNLVLAGPVAVTALERLSEQVTAALEGRGVSVEARIGHNATAAKASGAASRVLATRFSLAWGAQG